MTTIVAPTLDDDIHAARVAPTSAQLADAIATIAAALTARSAPTEPLDTLIRIEAKALAALGLELRSVRALEREGKLKTIAIGRSRFTTLRKILALVDELPNAPIADRAAVRNRDMKPAKSDLEVAVARAATRRARRTA